MAKKRHYESKKVSYDSIAGAPSKMNGQPMRSFIEYWPEQGNKPGHGYPDGAADIQGFMDEMHSGMKKQWSDKLY